MMRKNVPIIMIIILIINSGCINNLTKNEEYFSYDFQIHIKPNISGEYNITVPILVHQDGTISEIMNDLYISKGEGIFKIISTEKGLALNIKSTTELLIISSKGKTNGETNVIWDILSLEKDTIYDGDVGFPVNKLNFFIFFNNETTVENIDLKITFEAFYALGKSDHSTSSECNGIIFPSIEWQLIEGNRLVISAG